MEQTNLPRQFEDQVTESRLNKLETRISQIETTIKLQDNLFRLKQEEAEIAAQCFDNLKVQLDELTHNFESKLLQLETKHQLLQVKCEIDLPAHILKMSAKVERKCLEKVKFELEAEKSHQSAAEEAIKQTVDHFKAEINKLNQQFESRMKDQYLIQSSEFRQSLAVANASIEQQR